VSAPRVLVNAVSVRAGGSETFLANLLPLLADCLSTWEFRVLLRSSRRHLYSGLPA
jgi:hypothetical protein